MELLKYVKDVAKEHYKEKTYKHVLRVAMYVCEDNTIPEDLRDLSTILAICHDLKEDTNWNGEIPKELFPDFDLEYFNYCLDLLTHNVEKETYNEYIQKIKSNYKKTPEVYFVKKADIKDHLILKDTLTPKLKDKYLDALRYFL